MLQLVPGDRDQNGLLRPPGRSTYVAVPVAPGCGWLIRTVRFCRNGLWRPGECTARRRTFSTGGGCRFLSSFRQKATSAATPALRSLRRGLSSSDGGMKRSRLISGGDSRSSRVQRQADAIFLPTLRIPESVLSGLCSVRRTQVRLDGSAEPKREDHSIVPSCINNASARRYRDCPYLLAPRAG